VRVWSTVLKVLAYRKNHCDILSGGMKQHILQFILLITLVTIVGLVLKNEDFGFVKKKQAEIEEQSPLNATTTPVEEPRELLFRNIKPLDLEQTTEAIPFDEPRVIVSNGVVRNPNYFYSLPGSSTKTTDVETFINQASSTGAKISYSTSTGAITVVTNGPAPKNSEDVLDTLYVDKINKIAFMVDKSWKVTSKSGLISIQNVGVSGRNRILMTVTKNSVVKTADPVYGDFVLSFNTNNNTWIASNGSAELSVTNPSSYTKNGDAVFNGTTKVLTKIVGFGPSDYVIVNISGSDSPNIIHGFVAAIAKLQ
jgi:hypothetical protein